MTAKVSVVRSDPKILGGTPVFAGTRVPIQVLFDCLEAGDSLDRFLDQYPTVAREQALAALESAREALTAGYIRQLAAGVYSYLFLAQRSLLKITQIVREGMDRMGAQEFYLPALHPAELWQGFGGGGHTLVSLPAARAGLLYVSRGANRG